MKSLCNSYCQLLKQVDMFGKEPEFYYKGKPKKTSWVGRIFSVIYVIIYLAFFLYKLLKMLRKIDVVFYDTLLYSAEPPSIKVTNENFYGGFALEDPATYDVFIDEGIYIPKAFFKRAERQGDIFNWQIKELELEPCKLEKFGSVYQDIFKTKDLKNHYCFKEMDFVLEGHFSYDMYSFFYIQFFPCVNTSNKNDCKPLEVIDYYLSNTFISLEFQDIELTPNNYKVPFRPRNADIYTTIGTKLFKEIHAFFQIVNIETDMDWMGFDELKDIKSEIHLKYDEMISMSNLIENNIYETGESFCDVTIKLSENVRTEKRTYTKLITILGDVGGFMEVIFTIFKIISSFSIDILYEISLVNNLFNFDLNKKIIILKEKKKLPKKNNFPKINEIKLYNSIKNKSSRNTIFSSEERINYSKSGLTSISNFIANNNKKAKIKKIYSSKRKTIIFNNQFNIKDFAPNSNNINHQEENGQKNQKIINKIKYNRACIYLCFFFTRKRKNIQNILLDEGMNIISEKMDIFNMFKKIYKDEELQEKIKNRNIEMSDECKLKFQSLNSKVYQIK